MNCLPFEGSLMVFSKFDIAFDTQAGSSRSCSQTLTSRISLFAIRSSNRSVRTHRSAFALQNLIPRGTESARRLKESEVSEGWKMMGGRIPETKRIHESTKLGARGRKRAGGRHSMRRWVGESGKVVGGGDGLVEVGLMRETYGRAVS